jgi:hypothetical protein
VFIVPGNPLAKEPPPLPPPSTPKPCVVNLELPPPPPPALDVGVPFICDDLT